MKDDSVQVRDAELRRRIDQLVKDSNGVVSMSAIVRAALDEKLTELETLGVAALLRAGPAPAHSVRDELSNAGESMIIRKDLKSPKRARGDASRARGK